MTTLLAKAFEAAQKLPASAQDELAQHLLADIEGELRWERTIEDSSESLAALARQALQRDAERLTSPLDPEQM